MNPFDMMKNLQQMQQTMQEMQAKVATIRVEGHAGGDMVRVLLDGTFAVLSVTIDPTLLKTENALMVQDLVVAAIADAHSKLKEILAREMGSAAGGLSFLNQFLGR